MRFDDRAHLARHLVVNVVRADTRSPRGRMIVEQLARDGSLRAELEPTIAADLLWALAAETEILAKGHVTEGLPSTLTDLNTADLTVLVARLHVIATSVCQHCD
jgi:hypothetical protein